MRIMKILIDSRKSYKKKNIVTLSDKYVEVNQFLRNLMKNLENAKDDRRKTNVGQLKRNFYNSVSMNIRIIQKIK